MEVRHSFCFHSNRFVNNTGIKNIISMSRVGDGLLECNGILKIDHVYPSASLIAIVFQLNYICTP